MPAVRVTERTRLKREGAVLDLLQAAHAGADVRVSLKRYDGAQTWHGWYVWAGGRHVKVGLRQLVERAGGVEAAEHLAAGWPAVVLGPEGLEG
jgi:hypothetical protein